MDTHRPSGPPGNQDARGEPGAGKSDHGLGQSQSQAGQPGNTKSYEDRRNASACFKNDKKTEDWHADFLGLMVTEDLPAGTRVWVNVRKRLTRKGEVYISVVLKRQQS
jgi:hypothetical protein